MSNVGSVKKPPVKKAFVQQPKNKFIQSKLAESVKPFRHPQVKPLRKVHDCLGLGRGGDTWDEVFMQKSDTDIVSMQTSYSSMFTNALSIGDRTNDVITTITAIDPLPTAKFLLKSIKKKIKMDCPGSDDLLNVIGQVYFIVSQIGNVTPKENLKIDHWNKKHSANIKSCDASVQVDEIKHEPEVDQEKFNELQTNLENLLEKNENLQLQITSQADEINDLKNLVSKAKKDLLEKEALYSELHSRANSKEEELQQKISELMDDFKKRTETIQALERHNSDLQKNVKELESERNTFMNERFTTLESLTKKLEICHEKIESLNQKFLIAKMEKEKYAVLLESRDEQIEILRKNFNEIKKLSIDNLSLCFSEDNANVEQLKSFCSWDSLDTCLDMTETMTSFSSLTLTDSLTSFGVASQLVDAVLKQPSSNKASNENSEESSENLSHELKSNLPAKK